MSTGDVADIKDKALKQNVEKLKLSEKPKPTMEDAQKFIDELK